MGRTAAVVGLRFLLACVALGAALHMARPVLYPGVARVARDVAVLTTPRGLVSSVSWLEESERFRLLSQSLRTAIHVKSVSLLLILVLPAAFTFSLPAPRRLLATFAVLVGCFLIGSAIVGQDLVAFLSHEMAGQGVALFSPWLSLLHEGWINLGWDFAMIGVPATVCIFALWPLLGDEPESEAAAAGRWSWRAASLAAVAALGILLGLDLVASARVPDGAVQREYLLALGGRDPDLPDYFLRRGDESLEEGRIRAAAAYFNRASLFPVARARAAEGIAGAEQLRAARSGKQ